MRGKRAQFFLLAAVIISAVIISFGAGTNRAVVIDEPVEFYDSSADTQREIAAFLDYAIYKDFNNEALVDFLNLVAENIQNTNPGINFAFIYGKQPGDMYVMNYGTESLYVSGEEIRGRTEIESIVVLPNGVATRVLELTDVEEVELEYLPNPFTVGVERGEEHMSFGLSRDRQVILIMQKEEGGEKYVSIG